MHSHHWDVWLSYEEGMSEPYHYYRYCKVVGCSFKQEVEDLVPEGLCNEFDTKNSVYKLNKKSPHFIKDNICEECGFYHSTGSCEDS